MMSFGQINDTITACDSLLYNGIYLTQSGNYYTFSQIGLDIDGEAGGDYSGFSTSLSADGNILAIGALYNDGNGTYSGHTRIYSYDDINHVWNQLGADIDGEAVSDKSGRSVSLSADGFIVAIGAPDNDGNGSNSGHTRIYSYDNINDAWNQLGGDIDGEGVGDDSGTSVSLSADGNVVAIGAPYNDGNGSMSGHTRIYSYDNINDEWYQLGVDIDGEAADDFSGMSVSLSSDGKIVAVGALGNDVNGIDAGHVRIYSYDDISDNWGQLGGDIDGEDAGDWFGASVSLSSDGKIVAIGAPNNDGNGSDSGHARVYSYDDISGSWGQLGGDIDGEYSSDESGRPVSLSSDGFTIAIGAPFNDENGSNSGHTRIYSYDNINDAWNQLGADIDGEGRSGFSVSLSDDGKTIAIGATFAEDENGILTGHTRVFSNESINLTINSSTLSSITAEGLDSYTAPSGTVYTTGGVYTDTIQNAAGCDSIITIDLSLNYTGIGELNNTPKQLIKIVDVLGRETPFKPNTPLLYIYNDGTVERKMIIKE